jgi:transposase-like protein
MPARHPVEFRQRAVELARTADKPVAALAKDLGISESCLRNWMAQADADDGGRSDRLTSAEKSRWKGCAAAARPRCRRSARTAGRKPPVLVENSASVVGLGFHAAAPPRRLGTR